ncbi:hypothetical protein JCM10207_001197 [Rhodosporidiobolus poonsookiae]
MQSSLSLVPSSQPTSTSLSLDSTANPHGLHDSLRYGLRSLAADVSAKHPLENRIAQWDQTRENLSMTLQRNLYGVHAPVRLMMERELVRQTPAPASLSALTGSGFTRSSNVHLDVLMGRDEEIEVADVLVDRLHTAPAPDFHSQMERKLRL